MIRDVTTPTSLRMDSARPTNEQRLAAAHAALSGSGRQGLDERGLAEPPPDLRFVPPLLGEQPIASGRAGRRGAGRLVPHVEADDCHGRTVVPDPQG